MKSKKKEGKRHYQHYQKAKRSEFDPHSGQLDYELLLRGHFLQPIVGADGDGDEERLFTREPRVANRAFILQRFEAVD